MKTFLRITLVSAILFSVIACADKKDDNKYEIEQNALDAWVKEHVIGKGINAERQENGMYIVFPENRQPADITNTITLSDWIKINYKGSTLDGKVFMVRERDDAYREGTLSAYAHYVPRYLQYRDAEYTGIPKGIHYALGKMRKNETCTIYVPSWLAQTPGLLNTSNGFGGSYSYPTGLPLKFELTLVDIIGPNASTYEKSLLEEYVAREWGMSERDTLTKDLYIHITYDQPDVKEKVEKSDNINVVYAGYFLEDGYLLDTNDGALCYELIGNEEPHLRRDTTKYVNPLKTSLISIENTWVSAFKKLIEADTLVYDCTVKLAFTSEHGYGASGTSNTPPSTIVQPYTPLLFEVKVLSKIIEEEDEDGDEEGNGEE